MTTSRHLGVVALAFAAFTAACGGDGSSGPSFPDSVSTADAEDFADGIADYATYVADGMNFNGPSIALAAPAMASRVRAQLSPRATISALTGMSFQQPDLSMLDWRTAGARVQGVQASASAAGCTVTASGWEDPSFEVPVDLNGNDIPDDAYLKYVCTMSDTVATDTIVTQTMSVEFRIKEIAGSLFGEVITYNVDQNAHDNHGRYQFVNYDIDGKLDVRSGSAVDQASFKIRAESNLSGDVEFEEAGDSFSNAFDPDGTITLGNDLPDGELTLGGRRYYANSDGDNLSFTIDTPTPLAYDAACALADTNPPFSGGVLRGRLNGSSSQASFEVTFTSCGNLTIDVDGAYDEPVVVVAHP